MRSDHIFSRYVESTKMLSEVERIIPLASQTFSKSRTQYPPKVSPLFALRSSGCKTWDIDGNEYIDLVSSLAAVTLGYGDPEIEASIIEQLKSGVTLSLPGLLEFEVAKLIHELVPSAEKVRFAKTGSDATAGAIRLARAFTSRDHILIGGYHGWQDWYIGTTSMSNGVPQAVADLSHNFKINDFQSVEDLLNKYKDQVAAIILEPISAISPSADFLTFLHQRSRELGIILIFDETVTGFRISPGGAQEHFGIVPDLTTFGKGIANGFPLSVLCGRAEIMNLMDKVFFSGTFGGELLSLAAAKVVLTKIRDEDVTGQLARTGAKLNLAVLEVTKTMNFRGLSLSGHPSWQFLNWDNLHFKNLAVTKTLFLQEMFFHGVLILGSHNITLAHDDSAIAKVQKAYREALSLIQYAESTDSYDEFLLVDPILPLFKIR